MEHDRYILSRGNYTPVCSSKLSDEVCLRRSEDLEVAESRERRVCFSRLIDGAFQLVANRRPVYVFLVEKPDCSLDMQRHRRERVGQIRQSRALQLVWLA